MARINSLLMLVNSLTKGEKRYFKMYTALQEGEKDYLYLFELLEKKNPTEEAKRLFHEQRPKASFEATGKYLYKVIMNCLLHVRIDQDKTGKLATGLLKANILFEKSLYDQGFKKLKQVQTSAELFEQHFIQLWAAKMELYYLNNLYFNTIPEAELIQKQLKVQEVIKQERHITQHSALYELLRHRLLTKGTVRTKQQKEELNDLVVAELSLMSNPLMETFESAKTHLLFQAHYFITVSDYPSALKTFYELNALFEENEYIWADSPHDYLSSIEGILDSLHTIKRYEEMDFFLEKLQRLQQVSQYFDVTIQRLNLIYKIVPLINTGEFEKAIVLKNSFEDALFKKIHLLDLSKQAAVYLYTALLYVGSGNINKAHYYLNHILLESKLYNDFPIFRTFRLIHLLVHYEMGNHDYVESEIRSIKRGLPGSLSPSSLPSSEKSYLLEKIVFGFVQYVIPTEPSRRAALWDKISKKFMAIQNDKFEIQILKIFDFELWIKAKLGRKNFGELLREKQTALID